MLLDLLQVFVFQIPPNLTYMESDKIQMSALTSGKGKSFSPHIIRETKGLEERLVCCRLAHKSLLGGVRQ